MSVLGLGKWPSCSRSDEELFGVFGGSSIDEQRDMLAEVLAEVLADVLAEVLKEELKEELAEVLRESIGSTHSG